MYQKTEGREGRREEGRKEGRKEERKKERRKDPQTIEGSNIVSLLGSLRPQYCSVHKRHSVLIDII
jgi:hypothetical protein